MRPFLPRVVALLVVVAATGWVAVASGAHPPAPTSLNSPLKDGCQRNQVGVVFLTTPEWVYVHRDPRTRMAEGLVRVSHVAKEDAPGEHDSHDYNANMVVAPAYRYLLGGSPQAKTGNYVPGGEEGNRLHIEWETAAVPAYAWPTDGDHAKVWGSWIWDCGHWMGDNGQITGEATELHPLSALVVTRHAPYRPRTTQTETDVFISSNGTRARAVERCARELRPISPTNYGPDFRACAQYDASKRPQPVAGRYSFFVPAPRRPTAHSRLTYRMVGMIRGGAGREQVTATRTGLRVTVSMPARRPTQARPVRYGKSFFVGWTGRQRTRPTPLRVTFKTLTIHHSDPDLADKDPGGGKWNLHIDLNGYRKLVNEWVPALRKVNDGQRLRINRTVTVNVPAGQRLTLLVQGRECDIPSATMVAGNYVPVIAPCPPNPDEGHIALANDDPGTILDVYRSAQAAVGDHTTLSAATSNRFPGSPPISFGDGKQGNGDYELSYTVTRGR